MPTKERWAKMSPEQKAAYTEQHRKWVENNRERHKAIQNKCYLKKVGGKLKRQPRKKEEPKSQKMRVPIHKQILKDKNCLICSSLFKPKSGVHKFCCIACKEKYNQMYGSMSVSKQYERISGNWKAYLGRLLTSKRKHDGLTLEALLDILEKQEYKCALSGEDMTCVLDQGTRSKTNASIDRIEAGGPYSPNNIQLVCRAVNSFRNDININEYIWWCKKVAEKAKEN